MNKQQFAEYAKTNGITLAKTTKAYYAVQAGTRLWFGYDRDYVSTFDND